MERMSSLFGRRVMLRGLVLADFEAWSEVRLRCGEWLTRWEPQRLPNQPDVTTDRDAFAVRCSARQRERQPGANLEGHRQSRAAWSHRRARSTRAMRSPCALPFSMR